MEHVLSATFVEYKDRISFISRHCCVIGFRCVKSSVVRLLDSACDHTILVSDYCQLYHRFRWSLSSSGRVLLLSAAGWSAQWVFESGSSRDTNSAFSVVSTSLGSFEQWRRVQGCDRASRAFPAMNNSFYNIVCGICSCVNDTLTWLYVEENNSHLALSKALIPSRSMTS